MVHIEAADQTELTLQWHIATIHACTYNLTEAIHSEDTEDTNTVTK